MALLSFLLVLFPVVVIHEAGHAIAAKSCGIPVRDFSVGFGKKLFSFMYKGTDYAWRLLPFGGYVTLYPIEQQHLFDENHTRWERTQVLIAGPLANFALAFVMYFIVALVEGVGIVAGFMSAIDLFVMTIQVLLVGAYELMTGQLSLITDMGGPLDIARLSEEVRQQGLSKFLLFIGLLSMNIGILNLLPIPGLDGGKLTIIGIETISRRDFSKRTRDRINAIGVIFLLIVILIVLGGDIWQWVFN